MGTLAINGEIFRDLGQCFSPGPNSGTYYCLPPFGHPPRMGSLENEIMYVSFPGVDGVWRKNMGFRGRPIYIQLATLNIDKDTTWTDALALFTKFEQFERFTINLPESNELQGCALIPSGGEVIDEFAFGGSDEDGNRICVITSWQFRQYSFSNA
jgi:hypothetical protein